MKDVTKGPGDLWCEEENLDMDGFEEWLEDLDGDPHKKLELLERFITFKQTATGTVVNSIESPYGTISTVAYSHEDAFESWLVDVYINEQFDRRR